MNKVTPLHDLSWWIKWAASICILLAVLTRTAGVNHYLDIWLSFSGTFGWLLVGYLWHDRALIVLNTTLTGLHAIILIKAYASSLTFVI
jgi:hypothetical protein